MAKRPVLNIPTTKIEVLHNVVSIVVLIGTFFYLYQVWSELPAKIPSHFNGLGEVDGWGGKSGLLLMPIISAVLYVGLTVLSKYPHVFNYLCEITEENAYRQYVIARSMISWMKVQIVVLFGYIEWIAIQAAFGNGDGLGVWFLPVIIIIFLGTVIYYIIRSVRMA